MFSIAASAISNPLKMADTAIISIAAKVDALIEYASISSKTDRSARITVTIPCAHPLSILRFLDERA